MGTWFSLMIYLIGVLYGAAFFSFVMPYGILVGCSCGVFSVIGGVVSMLFIVGDNKIKIFSSQWLIAAAALTLFQIIVEIVTYILHYDPTIAYFCHISSFWVGFLFTSAVGLFHRSVFDKLIGGVSLAIISIITVVVVTKIFVTDSLYAWNILGVYQPSALNCCADMYKIIATTNMSVSAIRSSFVCDGNTLELDA